MFIFKSIFYKLSLIFVAASLLTACVKLYPAIPRISDIDKSSPSVTLTALLGAGIWKVDWEAGRRKATKQCQEFGYAVAESLGFINNKCAVTGQYGCVQGESTRKYICKNN